MALSKEQTDFCRMSFCVLDLSGRMFRDILTKKIPVTQCKNVARAIRNLRPEQRNIVNNVANRRDYNEFDITLAYSFFRNGCPNLQAPSQGWGKPPLATDTNIADDIERMRILRNEVYGHASAASISGPEFSRHINSFQDICNRMDGVNANHLINSTGVPYAQDLQTILTRCMDTATHQKYLKEIQELHLRERKAEEEIANMKENMRQIQQRLGQNEDEVLYLRHETKIVRKKVEDEEVKLEGHVKQVSRDIGEVKKEIDSVRMKHIELDRDFHNLQHDVEIVKSKDRNQLDENDRQMARLRDLTTARLERHLLYVNRHKLESDFISKLDENSSSLCVITGGSGQGKTSLGLEILKTYRERDFDIFIVHVQNELSSIIKLRQRSIILIDDDMGHRLKQKNSRILLQEYIRRISNLPMVQNLKIVLILDEYMMADGKLLLPKCVLFHSQANIFNLNDWKMNSREKMETFLLYQTEYRHNVLDWEKAEDHAVEAAKITTTPSTTLELSKDIDEIVASDPHYDFPQTCKLFFTNQTCFRLGVAFFTDAHTRLCEEMSNLLLSGEMDEKCQYFLLCSILFKKTVAIDNVQEFAELIGENNIPIPDRVMAERALDILRTRRFIKQYEGQHNYDFSNFSIFVAVLISLGRYFPDILLKNADYNIIFDFVCSSNYNSFPTEVCCHIPEDRHVQLARKLLEYDKSALFHRTMSDETFVPVLLDEMCEKYRWGSNEDEDDSEHSMKTLFLLACNDQRTDPSLAKELIRRLRDDEEKNKEALKEGLFLCVRAGNLGKVRLFEHISDDLRKEAFIEAIKSQKEDIVSYLRVYLKDIYTKSLMISIEYGTPYIVETIITGFTFSEEELLDGLLNAVKLHRDDVVQIFMNCIDASRLMNFQYKIEEKFFVVLCLQKTRKYCIS